MTAIGRLLWWPWLLLWRFVVQFATRKGRRRLRRRVSWRLLALVGFGPWVYPFVVAQFHDEMTQFVRGRVQVRGSLDPVTDIAVVLVPLAVLGPDGEPVWMWPDVDGWFSMHAFPGAGFGGLYGVDVVRPGCAVERLDERRFWLLAPWGRRLHLEVGPCRVL